MKNSLRIAILALSMGLAGMASGSGSTPDWSINATIIEACSCPMFCQCYFNGEPAGHSGGEHAGHAGHGAGEVEHFCRFNNAFRVNSGHFGEVKLDGIKFWASGDLGADFASGEAKWATLTFDRTVTAEQREGLKVIVGHLYPMKWGSFTTAEGDISWTAGQGRAHALLDGGKTAEVKLTAASGANKAGEPVVIQNLKYWGTGKNDGFVLMPNEVVAYRTGPNAFEYKGTNGFMITFDYDSRTVAAQMAQAGK